MHYHTRFLYSLSAAVLLWPVYSILQPVGQALTGSAIAASPTPATPPSNTATTITQPEAPIIDGVDSETGFRMERYRAPVPSVLPGGTLLETEEVAKRLQTSTLFIDVYPPKGLGPDPIDGTWLVAESHQNIAGSVWLPEVGRGYLEAGHEEYFRRNLDELSKQSYETELLFYCTADCWQSWNAARRAILWGYRNVFWYPDGIDGWMDEELPLVDAVPVNYFGQ